MSNCTTADLADTLGISVQQVLALGRRGILIKTARNRFDRERSVRAFIEFREREAARLAAGEVGHLRPLGDGDHDSSRLRSAARLEQLFEEYTDALRSLCREPDLEARRKLALDGRFGCLGRLHIELQDSVRYWPEAARPILADYLNIIAAREVSQVLALCGWDWPLKSNKLVETQID